MTRSHQPKNSGGPFANDPLVQALFKQTTAGVAIVNGGGIFVRVNARFCGIVGRARAELAAMRMHDITHPEDLPRNAELFERLMGGGSSAEIDKRYVRPDGSIVWAHNIVFAITGADGQSKFGVAIVSDISDRQQIDWERHMRQCPDKELTALDLKNAESLFNDWLRNRKRTDDGA